MTQGVMNFVPSKSPVMHYILTDHFSLDFMVAAHEAFYSTLYTGCPKKHMVQILRTFWTENMTIDTGVDQYKNLRSF